MCVRFTSFITVFPFSMWALCSESEIDRAYFAYWMFFQQFNLTQEISHDLETLKANTKALNHHKTVKKTE